MRKVLCFCIDEGIVMDTTSTLLKLLYVVKMSNMNIIICSELHLVKYTFRIRIWNVLAIAWSLAI